MTLAGLALLFSVTAPVAKAINAACYSGIHEVAADRAFVQPLADACLNSLPSDKSGLWNSELCVAAGVAAGVSQLNDYANCFTNLTVPGPTQFGSLEYSVYASIVGSCAYASGGCPVSEQNLVDLVYGQISAAGLTTYPTSGEELIQHYLTPIFTWTNFTTTEGIPYLNFNDWLHYSGFTSHV
ncbi:hypothetical protein PENSPDRAFT_668105 [Peniophora sp. CONT]|nr:hypothetical protein PENSPDRAFT_668105 [Peniophora sp. CONT]